MDVLKGIGEHAATDKQTKTESIAANDERPPPKKSGDAGEFREESK